MNKSKEQNCELRQLKVVLRVSDTSRFTSSRKDKIFSSRLADLGREETKEDDGPVCQVESIAYNIAGVRKEQQKKNQADSRISRRLLGLLQEGDDVVVFEDERDESEDQEYLNLILLGQEVEEQQHSSVHEENENFLTKTMFEI